MSLSQFVPAYRGSCACHSRCTDCSGCAHKVEAHSKTAVGCIAAADCRLRGCTCAICTDCSKNKQLRLSQASRWPPREILLLLLHLYGLPALCHNAEAVFLFFGSTMRICKIPCIVHFCIHTHTSRSIGLPPFSSQPLYCFMIQKCDSVMSGHSNTNLDTIEIEYTDLCKTLVNCRALQGGAIK